MFNAFSLMAISLMIIWMLFERYAYVLSIT